MKLSRSDLKQWLKERGITKFAYPTATRSLVVEVPYDSPRVVRIVCTGRNRYELSAANTGGIA